MRPGVKKGIIGFVIIVVAAIVVVLVQSYALNRLQKGLRQKLEEFNKTDFNVHYDSIYVHWRQRVIIIDKLVVDKGAYDTTCLYPEFISVHQVRIKGFHLLQLLFNRELKIDQVILDQPHMVVRQNSHLLSDSSSKKGENEFMLMVNHLRLISARVEYTDSASCELNSEFISTLETTGLRLELQKGKPFELSVDELLCDHTQLRFPKKFYTVNILKMSFHAFPGDISFDTIRIIPHFGKLDFGRKKGFDIDRIEGVIPFLKFSGFAYQYQDTFALQAKKADIQMFLRIFHDKRLPHENIHKPLPVHLLRDLPFGLTLDTLKVIKSFVAYEEFAPEAESAGSIFFDNLKASIANINNDRHLTDGQTIMTAQADLMGQGELSMHTVFPWKNDRDCLMEGTLKNFSFAKINPMLKPATLLEIESGMLDNLAFRFSYNESHSEGELTLRYHDLKIIHFKKEEHDLEKTGRRKRKGKNSEEEKRDNLKTFIINAFVIRKNMNGDLPEEKRTGQVYFHRDKTRSIFNYWWKSLFSGLKSAFHLDKAKAKNEKKKEKK